MSLTHQTQLIFVSRSFNKYGEFTRKKTNINTDGQIHAPDRRFGDRKNINYVLHIQWLYRVYVISLYFCCCDEWSKPGFFRWIFFNICCISRTLCKAKHSSWFHESIEMNCLSFFTFDTLVVCVCFYNMLIVCWHKKLCVYWYAANYLLFASKTFSQGESLVNANISQREPVLKSRPV